MSRDAERKRTLLAEWWAEFIPARIIKLLDRLSPFNPATMLARLGGLSLEPSVYVLFSAEYGQDVPVYVGQASNPVSRWNGHIEGLRKGQKSYARWRAALFDTEGRAVAALTLLVVPVAAITRPPIPGFPVTMGAVEYQLVGLAQDAYPGRLLNSEGRGR